MARKDKQFSEEWFWRNLLNKWDGKFLGVHNFIPVFEAAEIARRNPFAWSPGPKTTR